MPAPLLRALAVASLTVLLASCAPGPSSGGTQPLPDACATVSGRVDEAMAAFADVDPADPAASASALTDVATSLGSAAGSIDHAELEATVTTLQTGIVSLRDAAAAAASGDLAAAAGLASATEQISGAAAGFRKLCTG